MKIVDLFCGGGGSSSGFHQAGFTTAFAIDKEYHCINTFNANFGNVALQGNVSTIRSELILDKTDGKPTLVTASPPCEPFTSANENRIKDPYMRLFDDETGRLTIETLRIIADLDPEFYMIENVTGIIDGENKQLITEEMVRLGLGEPRFNVINAAQWGVPSHRTRVLITNFKFKPPKKKYREVKDVISDLPDPNYPDDFEMHYTIPMNPSHAKKISNLKQGDSLVYFRGSNSDKRNFIRLRFDEIAPVVMGKSRFFHPTQDRLLTPLEVARLMSFPDTHKFLGTKDQILDLIGEAVPPLITEEIGNQLVKLL